LRGVVSFRLYDLYVVSQGVQSLLELWRDAPRIFRSESVDLGQFLLQSLQPSLKTCLMPLDRLTEKLFDLSAAD
jgi:hypothetical protein